MIFRVLTPVLPRVGPRILELVRDVLTLGKPRITLLVAFTAAVGFGDPNALLLPTLVGLSLTVAGANALNMWLERDVDAEMTRTANRPLPAGRLAPSVAFALGLLWAASGLAILALQVNALAFCLAALGVASYVLAYTPLKKVTPYALHIGAIPGAISTLVGGAAATGRIEPRALMLFFILFLWQIPHFLALASYRKQDYVRAGLRVWPIVHGDVATRRQAVVFTLLLLGASLLPAVTEFAGKLYGATALLLGLGFVFAALSRKVTNRALFLYSLAYLPLLLGVMTLSS